MNLVPVNIGIVHRNNLIFELLESLPSFKRNGNHFYCSENDSWFLSVYAGKNPPPIRVWNRSFKEGLKCKKLFDIFPYINNEEKKKLLYHIDWFKK